MNGHAVAVRLTQLSRHFGTVRALDAIDLEVYDGEFFSMLGPSGSGKTTCLRLIAGFERPTAGQIALFGVDVSHVPPYNRPVNTVFQDYALFPHMSVGDNVGYGLMIKKIPRKDRIKQVNEMLDLVRLSGMINRRPSQLSGGQRQRVALARALINHPRVLLLDEPLGALDLKLRQEMQVELKNIQKTVGITFIFVTHDQEEALTMSDRVAVFNHGRIEQVGTPEEVYEQPQTSFVAGFVGISNILREDDAERISGSRQALSIRPEKIRICPEETPIPPESFGVVGTIRDVIYLGINTRYLVELDTGGELSVIEQNLQTTSIEIQQARGRRVTLLWNRAHAQPLRE